MNAPHRIYHKSEEKKQLFETANAINIADPTKTGAALWEEAEKVLPAHRQRGKWWSSQVNVMNRHFKKWLANGEIRPRLPKEKRKLERPSKPAKKSRKPYNRPAFVSLPGEADPPWEVHIAYEMLHPFTDGNGRSGRMLWAWQMRNFPLDFLHTFYYQTLNALSRTPFA